MLTPEEVAQVEQVVERVVKRTLAEEPSLRRLGDGNMLSLIELRLNQLLGELRQLNRSPERPPRPPAPPLARRRRDG